MDKQAFVNGFVKRANEYGLSSNQAFELLKAADDGFLGGLGGLGGLAAGGLTGLAAAHGLGAMVGSNYAPISDKDLEREMAYMEDPSMSKGLKYALIPGYAGYRQAKNDRVQAAYQKYKDEHRPLAPQQPQY